MASNVRVSVFTPASVVKFTGGAHIRAFTPRALEAMPANVRLKAVVLKDPSIERFEPAISVANMTGINARKALPIITDGCVGKQNIAELLRNPDFRNHTGISTMRNNDSADRYPHDETIAAKLARICVPEDVLEPMNIAAVLRRDMTSFHGDFALSVKEGACYDAWNGLTAAYLSHMEYDPMSAGAALGSIAISMKGSDITRMPRTFLTDVAQLLYPEDKKSTAQVLVAALQKTNPADKTAQIRAVTETTDGDIINFASNNWNEWRLKPGSEANADTAVATSFASALKGDLQLSNIISNAFSLNGKSFPSREGFAAELVNVVKGLDVGLPEKIDLLIKIANRVRSDQSLPEPYRTVIPEELIRELLVS